MGAGTDAAGTVYDWNARHRGWSPEYQRYVLASRPGATNMFEAGKYLPSSMVGDIGSWFAPNNPVQPYAIYEPMSYTEWQALMNNASWNKGTTTPTTPPTPSDNLLGLMKQSADPWGTYGQMGVNEPYLSNINNRFGWSSEGLAYPTQLQASPTWYNPPIVYPDVVQPPIKKASSTSGTK